MEKLFTTKQISFTSTGLCFFNVCLVLLLVPATIWKNMRVLAPTFLRREFWWEVGLVLLLEWHLLQLLNPKDKGLWLYKRKEYFSIILEQPVLLHLLIWILLFVGEMGSGVGQSLLCNEWRSVLTQLLPPVGVPFSQWVFRMQTWCRLSNAVKITLLHALWSALQWTWKLSQLWCCWI